MTAPMLDEKVSRASAKKAADELAKFARETGYKVYGPTENPPDEAAKVGLHSGFMVVCEIPTNFEPMRHALRVNVYALNQAIYYETTPKLTGIGDKIGVENIRVVLLQWMKQEDEKKADIQSTATLKDRNTTFIRALEKLGYGVQRREQEGALRIAVLNPKGGSQALLFGMLPLSINGHYYLNGDMIKSRTDIAEKEYPAMRSEWYLERALAAARLWHSRNS